MKRLLYFPAHKLGPSTESELVNTVFLTTVTCLRNKSQ